MTPAMPDFAPADCWTQVLITWSDHWLAVLLWAVFVVLLVAVRVQIALSPEGEPRRPQW